MRMKFYTSKLFLVGLVFSIPMVNIFLYKFWSKDFFSGNFSASLSGAFFGAAAAFLFDWIFINFQESFKNDAALIKSKFIINKILKTNVQISEHIKKCNERYSYAVPWRNQMPYLHLFTLPNIDLNSLMFLINDKSEEALNTILLVEAQFTSLLSFIKIRNTKYHLQAELIEQSLRGATDRQSTFTGTDFAADKIKNIIGHLLYDELEDFTKIITELSADLDISCKSALTKLEP